VQKRGRALSGNSSTHRTKPVHQLRPDGHRGRKSLFLFCELATGVAVDLARRYAKAWTQSLKSEIAIRRSAVVTSKRIEPEVPLCVPSQQTKMPQRTNRKAFPGQWLDLFRNTASRWSRDKCAQLGAALAYYTVFSLAPLILVLLGIFGLIDGSQQAREKNLEQLRYLMDPNAVSNLGTVARRKGTFPWRSKAFWR